MMVLESELVPVLDDKVLLLLKCVLLFVSPHEPGAGPKWVALSASPVILMGLDFDDWQTCMSNLLSFAGKRWWAMIELLVLICRVC